MSKFAAWGANVMIRIRNPEVSEGGIALVGGGQNSIEPQGVVVSCGQLVREGKKLINRTVRFGAGMVMDSHFSEGEPYAFVLVNEAAIYSVALDDDEGVTLQ
jgi:hypothetical protein